MLTRHTIAGCLYQQKKNSRALWYRSSYSNNGRKECQSKSTAVVTALPGAIGEGLELPRWRSANTYLDLCSLHLFHDVADAVVNRFELGVRI